MARNKFDQVLLRKLAGKIGKSVHQTRVKICQRAAGRHVTPEAYFVHWLGEYGVGATRYIRLLPTDIKTEIRHLQDAKSTKSGSRQRGTSKTERVIAVDGFKFGPKSPLLTRDMIENANANARLYPALYILENSVRNLIQAVLRKKYGENWWQRCVETGLQRQVHGRMQSEKLNAWAGGRGQDPIYYTDFSDLAKILRRLSADFRHIFQGVPNGVEWLARRLDELTFSRNNVAHAAPLKRTSRTQFALYLSQWYDQLDVVNPHITITIRNI